MDTGLTNSQILTMITNLKNTKNNHLEKAKASNYECSHYLKACELQKLIDMLSKNLNLYEAVLGD